MLCGKTIKIIYKNNLYYLWFAEFSLYCNKDMCGLLNFHFIVIRTYVWLAKFSFTITKTCVRIAIFFVLDICIWLAIFFHAGHMYGLLFFFCKLMFKFE